MAKPDGIYVTYSKNDDKVRYGDKGKPGISSDDIQNDSSSINGDTVTDAMDHLNLADLADQAALSVHKNDTTNPHKTSIGNIEDGTLAELNAAVTDATLDDASDPRPPLPHDLGGAEHTPDTLANLNTRVSDATLGGLSNAVPQPLGVAAAGVGLGSQRDDHVHPHGNLSVGGGYEHDTDQIENLSALIGADLTAALETLAASQPSGGDMYENSPGVGTAINAAIQNTWYPWISASQGEVAGAPYLTFSDDNVNGDYLEIGASGGGKYQIVLTGSFSGSVSTIWEIYVFLNGGVSRIGARRALGTGGDVGAFGASGSLNLSPGDQLRVKVRCTTGAAKNFTCQIMDLDIHRVG